MKKVEIDVKAEEKKQLEESKTQALAVAADKKAIAAEKAATAEKVDLEKR